MTSPLLVPLPRSILAVPFFFFLNSFILISLSTTESYYYRVVTVFKAGGEGRVNYSKGERAALAGGHWGETWIDTNK